MNLLLHMILPSIVIAGQRYEDEQRWQRSETSVAAVVTVIADAPADAPAAALLFLARRPRRVEKKR